MGGIYIFMKTQREVLMKLKIKKEQKGIKKKKNEIEYLKNSKCYLKGESKNPKRSVHHVQGAF
jgi:hypothetical protein